jgi:DNA-binding protein HU-beta
MVEKLNKRELVDAIVEKTGGTRKDAETALAAVIDSISDAVAEGDRVQIPGFGSFEKRERAAREARNPQTGETIKIKKTNVPAFKAGSGLKTYVAASKKDQAAIRKARG